MSERKHTLGAPAEFSGVGAHTGKTVRVVLKPSETGRIIFRRRDLGGRIVAVDPAQAEAQSCIVLSSGAARVRTVEHLLASLLMCGVDSADVDLDGEEVPLLDGSASPIVRVIEKAGKKKIDAERRTLILAKPLVVKEGEASILLEPAAEFVVSYVIEYRHPSIGRQELSLRLDEETFKAEVAPARTFGFLKDAERLNALGLARGSSLENTVVIGDDGVVNPPLRFSDEFVRHKILDFVGDMALLGSPLRARVSARRAGHGLHLRAARDLHAQRDEFFPS
ncbi:MAG: UDP-3-O-[3-hydroxymyristoyl] N-acetylglucosamine deacetylase [Candidatus Aminicenantes bacterium]|nr:UDP-3-O-[3-hydroxymyristoyl] N-acetylglucosamine deacetylase [Candidatus Aminicenantes bacterium]